jgi:cyclopropane fatty-acyl-phospholipid synthase-like methyltransferase
VPRRPSAFARWVAKREDSAELVDVGCGLGRDAIFFANRGFTVTGIDFVPGVLKKARKKAQDEGASVDLRLVNLYSVRASLAQTALLARRPAPRIVYARHLLEDMRPHGRDNFWRLARTLVRDGGRCYLEFRTDRNDRKVLTGPQGQKLLDPEDVIAEAVATGARVTHRAQGAFKSASNNNPIVCRLVLEW